jgi:hypothetical protein
MKIKYTYSPAGLGSQLSASRFWMPPVGPRSGGGAEFWKDYHGDTPKILSVFLATPYPLQLIGGGL